MTNQILIRITEANKRLIKNLLDERKFTTWVNEQIEKNLSDEISLKKEIIELEENLKKTKENLKLIQDWNKQIITEDKKENEEMGLQELNYWKQSIILLNEKPDLIDGRINLYNNLFNKRLTKQEYIKKLDRMKKINSQ
jgi:hypothetical protein